MNYDYDASYLDSPDLADAEAWPTDTYVDYSEARPKRPGPVRPASGASAFKPRSGPSGGGSVTQAQLEAALARVREQITANANAIKTIDGRVRTVISDTQKLQAMTKKDLEELGDKMKAAKKAAPTRPHPRAPNKPPANVAAGAVAGAVDRIRDAAGGRTQ